MISRPTTDQLIADCCHELMEEILPALTDQTLQVRLAMAETVLRNAAVRAAHEIAWMRRETSELSSYAHAVEARGASAQLSAALLELARAPHESLHLTDVVETYERAGQAFTAALAAAQEAGAADLVEQARELLRKRV